MPWGEPLTLARLPLSPAWRGQRQASPGRAQLKPLHRGTLRTFWQDSRRPRTHSPAPPAAPPPGPSGRPRGPRPRALASPPTHTGPSPPSRRPRSRRAHRTLSRLVCGGCRAEGPGTASTFPRLGASADSGRDACGRGGVSSDPRAVSSRRGPSARVSCGWVAVPRAGLPGAEALGGKTALNVLPRVVKRDVEVRLIGKHEFLASKKAKQASKSFSPAFRNRQQRGCGLEPRLENLRARSPLFGSLPGFLKAFTGPVSHVRRGRRHAAGQGGLPGPGDPKARAPIAASGSGLPASGILRSGPGLQLKPGLC